MDTTNTPSNIALWGPKGAGKTWLLNAFMKDLDKYNTDTSNFSYFLHNKTGMQTPLINGLDAETFGPSVENETIRWEFQRRGKQLDKRSHQVSTHTHDIAVHDNPGDWLTNAVSPNNSNRNALAVSMLRKSNNLIMVLDPTHVIGTPIPGEEINPNAPTKTEYAQWFSILMQFLKEQELQANIAVCLSKSDKIKVYLETKELIRVIFGENIIRILEKSGFNINYFRVSATGKINHIDGKTESNLDHETQSIKDIDQWRPINVSAPFFWLFEIIERERIRKDDFFGDREKIYIPYPQAEMG
jgi:hypothetical protein